MKLTPPLSSPLAVQLIRFAATGGVATAVHFFVVIFIVWAAAMNPLYANPIGYTIGFIASFLGHRYWIFFDTTRHTMISLTYFCIIALLNFFINQGIFYMLLEKLSLSYFTTLIVSLVITAAISFLLSKYWAFSK